MICEFSDIFHYICTFLLIDLFFSDGLFWASGRFLDLSDVFWERVGRIFEFGQLILFGSDGFP